MRERMEERWISAPPRGGRNSRGRREREEEREDGGVGRVCHFI